jgi:uncharacterized SAM-binding protein YcdF (DUF218 family)
MSFNALILAVFIALPFIAAITAFVAIGLILNRRRLPRAQADAALVFGTGLEWKARSRCVTASDLFNRGLVRYLIVSGGVKANANGQNEAEWFRELLIESGVPAARILLEARATNTAQNVEYSLPILKERSLSSVVLVMSDFEGYRAHLTAKRAWQGETITIYDCHAPSLGHWSAIWWWTSRSGWHLTWYAVSRIFRYSLWRHI